MTTAALEHRGFLVEPDCERCLLRDSCDKVPPEGNPEADIAIVGQGPGWQETRAGRPFVGPSGQLLNRILREAGLARHHCWVTNVACGFPEMIPLGYGRFIPKGKVEKESMKTCAPRVLAELAIVKPKVVLALGTLTAEMLCDDVKGITQLHGSLNPLAAAAGHPAIVMPLFHPAHLLRGEQRFYPVVVEGFKRAARIARQGPATLGTLHVVDPCRETFEADLAFAEAFVDDVLRTGEDLAIDIETNEAEPSEAFLTVVGVASARRRQSIAITVRNWNRQRGTFDMIYSAEQWRRVEQLLARLLGGGNTKLYWNWGFDDTCMRRFFRLGGRVRDGMVLHHFAIPDVLHRLDFVVQSKLDVPPWKYHFRDKMKRGTAEHNDLLIYNAQDALYTALVFPIVEKEAREIGNLHIEDHQLAMGDMARRATLVGIPINTTKWQEIYDEKRAVVDAALKEIKQRIWAAPGSMESLTEFVNARRAQRASWKGKPAPEPIAPLTLEDFDPAKADHASWYLYDLLRLQPTRLTNGGAEKDPTRRIPSASYKGVLVYLKTPGVKAYVDWAEESATVRTLEGIKNDLKLDGRLHVSWSSVSMKGTRWTSKRNCFDAETEILTKDGWVRFPDLTEDSIVAQWSQGAVSFVQPTEIIEQDYEGPMIAVRNRHVDVMMTPDHRALLSRLRMRGTEWVRDEEVVPAQVLATTKQRRGGFVDRVTSYNRGGISVPHPRIMLLCAAQADGWRRRYGPKTAWAWYLSKPRKIARLREALTALGPWADWYETPLNRKKRLPGRKPETAFYLKESPAKQWLDDHLDAAKTFRGLLAWSDASLRAFALELSNWDGDVKKGADYATVNKANSDWAQIAHLLGGEGAGRPREFWGNHSKQACWILGRSRSRTSGYLGFSRADATVVEATQRKVYCVTVPSGFIVTRRNGCVSVQGNCQNWDDTLKKLTELPLELSWVGADAAQIEFRVAAFLAGIPELLALFNQEPFDEEKEDWKKYDPKYDGHSLIATEVFGDLYTKGDKKLKKALRTMVKRVVYALFYGAFPDKIFDTILEDKRVPSDFREFISDKKDYIERIHTGFSARFPQWDEWADDQIVQVRYSGMQHFPPFDRKRPWALSEMVEETKIRNTPIQLSAGDIVNMIFRKIDEQVRRHGIDAHFVLHGHDACEWLCATKDAERLKALINKCFDVTLVDKKRGAQIRIYGQAKIGRSLAEV